MSENHFGNSLEDAFAKAEAAAPDRSAKLLREAQEREMLEDGASEKKMDKPRQNKRALNADGIQNAKENRTPISEGAVSAGVVPEQQDEKNPVEAPKHNPASRIKLRPKHDTPKTSPEIKKEPAQEFQKGQKVKIQYDGQMVDWVLEDFDPETGNAVIHGNVPNGKQNFMRISDANMSDILKWNDGFKLPKPEKKPIPQPEQREKMTLKNQPRVQTHGRSINDIEMPERETIDKMKLKKVQQRQERRSRTEAADTSKVYDDVLEKMSKNVGEMFSSKSGEEIFEIRNQIYDAGGELARQYQMAKDQLTEAVKKESGKTEKVEAPRIAILNRMYNNMVANPATDSETINRFLSMINREPGLDNAENSVEETEPIAETVTVPETTEPTPEVKIEEPTEEELAKFEEAMSTDGFEEFLVLDNKNLEDRSIAETLKLFEIFKNKESVIQTISAVANERFSQVTGFEYTEGKDSVNEYINREAFEDPDKILKYSEQVAVLVEQQKTIKDLEAKAEQYKQTLPDHKLMSLPEYEEAFDNVPEIAKYFGPARRKIKENKEHTMKLLSSDSFLKNSVGKFKKYLFDIPYAAAHYSATLFGYHGKTRSEAREKIKTTVGAEKYNHDTENQYKAKIAEAYTTSKKVQEIEFQKNAIHEGYTTTKELLARAFLEAKEAIDAAKKKIKDEVDKILAKVAGVKDIQGAQDILQKNADAKLYGDANILSEKDIKEIQDRIDLKAREAIDNHVEKVLSGDKKDKGILGSLKKSMEEFMNSGVASMKKDQVKLLIREAINKVIIKTAKGGKQEDKIIHNRAVAFAKINKL